MWNKYIDYPPDIEFEYLAADMQLDPDFYYC